MIDIDTTAEPAAAFLRWMDDVRLSLPLDSKRPTVDRRFWADDGRQVNDNDNNDNNTHLVLKLQLHPTRPVAHWIESVITQALASSDDATSANATVCHVFRYQRFLEYHRAGGQLAVHTDGTKVCDDTGRRSTHTALLYLTDCAVGGETVLLRRHNHVNTTTTTEDNHDDSDDGDDGTMIDAVSPRRGRLLLFPHATPHAGAVVVATPKICWRAEVAMYVK